MLALLFPPPPPPPLSPPSPPSPTPQPPAVVLRPGLRLGWEADVRGDAATISITSINITASIISSTSQTSISVNNELSSAIGVVLNETRDAGDVCPIGTFVRRRSDVGGGHESGVGGARGGLPLHRLLPPPHPCQPRCQAPLRRPPQQLQQADQVTPVLLLFLLISCEIVLIRKRGLSTSWLPHPWYTVHNVVSESRIISINKRTIGKYAATC